MKFSPCIGQCSETGSHCRGCGRSHEEIDETGQLVKGLVAHLQKMEYDDSEEFVNFIAQKTLRRFAEAKNAD